MLSFLSPVVSPRSGPRTTSGSQEIKHQPLMVQTHLTHHSSYLHHLQQPADLEVIVSAVGQENDVRACGVKGCVSFRTQRETLCMHPVENETTIAALEKKKREQLLGYHSLNDMHASPGRSSDSSTC